MPGDDKPTPGFIIAARRRLHPDDLCPKIGKLGQQCLQGRFHGGRHTFPPHPAKKPSQPIL